jgi:hypothetical protein
MPWTELVGKPRTLRNDTVLLCEVNRNAQLVDGDPVFLEVSVMAATANPSTDVYKWTLPTGSL